MSTSTVSLSTELPLPAQRAAALARQPELMTYLLRPILHMRRLDIPDTIEPGATGSARLWWFGLLPTWTHHLTLERLDTTEIHTREHGGPVHTWNHHLTFEPIDEHHCRYTDEIETAPGLRGAPTRLFIKLMFGHRHRRWHTLANILHGT